MEYILRDYLPIIGKCNTGSTGSLFLKGTRYIQDRWVLWDLLLIRGFSLASGEGEGCLINIHNILAGSL